MDRYPLAKREIHLLKWISLFAILVELAILASLGYRMAGRLNGWTVTQLRPTYNGENLFFNALPDSSLFMFGVGILAFVQFYGFNKLFIYALPVRKNDLLRMKLTLGACAYTFWLLIYGVGLIYIFLQNEHWLKDLYLYFPEEIYLLIEGQNNVAAIMRYLLMLWIAVTGVYTLCVSFLTALENKIIAAILSFFAAWYPAFLSQSLDNGLNDFYRNNSESLSTFFFERVVQMTDYVRILSLPDMPVFHWINQRQSFVSLVAGQLEIAFAPSIRVIQHYGIKTVIALLLSIGFTWITVRYFEAGRKDEYQTSRRFVIAGVTCVILILLCRAPALIKLDPQITAKDDGTGQWAEIPINTAKTIDSKKLEAYMGLNRFLYAYTHYEDQQQSEEARQKAAVFFGLESLGYFNIGLNGDGLGFVFDADDYLSHTGIPTALEQERFSGLSEFVSQAERQFSERPVVEGSSMAEYSYFYYDSDSKSVIVYTISAYPHQTKPGHTSLKFLFQSTLSYPDAYMSLIQKLENENTCFSQYVTGGHMDMLVIENTSFIAHVADNRLFNSKSAQTIPSLPVRIKLYGRDGTIERVNISVVMPTDATVGGMPEDMVDGCLDVLGLSENGCDLAKSMIQNAFSVEGDFIETGELSGFAYSLNKAVIQGDYQLVEMKIRDRQ